MRHSRVNNVRAFACQPRAPSKVARVNGGRNARRELGGKGLNVMLAHIRSVGSFIGAHMPVIVPISVVLGISLPQVFGPCKAIVPLLFAVITFQGSLNTSVHQIIATLRHPHELIVILISSIVVMPVLAHLFGSLVFSDDQIVTGIVIEYSIPVAVVSFMWIDMYHGNASLGLAAILLSTVLSPITLPLAVKLLMGATVEIDAWSMVSDLAFMVAVPAMLGVALNEFTGGWGHVHLSPNLGAITKMLTVFVITCNSTGLSTYVRSLDPIVLESALFIVFFASFGFLLGFVAARVLHVPVPDLLTMVFCIGMRNISSGAVIATQFFPGSAIIPVMMGTLFQQVLAATSGAIVQHLTGDERERQRKRVRRAASLRSRKSSNADATARSAKNAADAVHESE